jgi:transposase-like protein
MSLRKNGKLEELTKAILERAFEAHMTERLGYEKYNPADTVAAQATARAARNRSAILASRNLAPGAAVR